MSITPKVIVFDVNETLLDLSPLKTKVNSVMGNEMAFELWFGKLLHYSLVETVTDSCSNFSAIAKATFRMLARRFSVAISDAEISSVLATIKQLPPHADVIQALTQLEKAGFTMVALTNGNQDVVEKQLSYAGIARFMKAIVSVERVQKYKPHIATYRFMLEKLNVKAGNALMVAAHGWDIVGAKRAGMQTAFVARDGKFVYPIATRPDMTGKTILEIADKLIMV